MTLNKIAQLNIRRKDDHLRFALEQYDASVVDSSPFEDIRFIHHSFSQVNQDKINLTTRWANQTHKWPIYINAMTGGSQLAYDYNLKLAKVAKATDLAIATGSISSALSNLNVKDSFKIMRSINPDGFIMANLGAHHSVDNAKRAVDLIQANALQIHLNLPQEVVMPEGDRDFSMWLTHIEEMVNQLDVPVIVKEVGFGMSKETIQTLINLGVTTIDISGRGGTNFINIENNRRSNNDLSQLSLWGQTTPESLIEAYPYTNQCNILASGGIRHSLDMVKAFALGAKSAGIAGAVLSHLDEFDVEKTIEWILSLQNSLEKLALMLNCQQFEDFKHTDLIIINQLKEWAEIRQFDYHKLAHRSTLK